MDYLLAFRGVTPWNVRTLTVTSKLFFGLVTAGPKFLKCNPLKSRAREFSIEPTITQNHASSLGVAE